MDKEVLAAFHAALADKERRCPDCTRHARVHCAHQALPRARSEHTDMTLRREDISRQLMAQRGRYRETPGESYWLARYAAARGQEPPGAFVVGAQP
jgi:hypothetical protein